jgi:hypothetical protein
MFIGQELLRMGRNGRQDDAKSSLKLYEEKEKNGKDSKGTRGTL